MGDNEMVVEFNRCVHSNSDIKSLLADFDFSKLNSKNYINHILSKKNKGGIKKFMIFVINNRYVKRWTDMIKWNQPKSSGPWSINVQDINSYRRMPGYEDLTEDESLIKKTAKFTYRRNQYTIIAYSTIGYDVEKSCCRQFSESKKVSQSELVLSRENKDEPIFRNHYRNFLSPKNSLSKNNHSFRKPSISMKKYTDYLREKEDEDFYLKKFKFHEEQPQKRLKFFDTDEEEENVFIC